MDLDLLSKKCILVLEFFPVPGEVGNVKNISEGRDHLQLIQDLASARRSNDQQSLALSTVQDIEDKKRSHLRTWLNIGNDCQCYSVSVEGMKQSPKPWPLYQELAVYVSIRPTTRGVRETSSTISKLSPCSVFTVESVALTYLPQEITHLF